MGLVLGIRDLEAGVQYCFGMGASMKFQEATFARPTIEWN